MLVVILLALWLTGIKSEAKVSPREQAVRKLNLLNLEDVPDIDIRNAGQKAQERMEKRQEEKAKLMSQI